MGSNKPGLSISLAAAALAAGICASSQAAPPAPVVGHGEAADPAAAYVVVVPHVKAFGNVVITCSCVISGRTTDGSPREYSFIVPTDRPSVVRVAPGRYYLSRLDLGYNSYPLDEEPSEFDAKPGQLNYPGDWTISTDKHDILRNARTIGWRIYATLWTGEAALDLGKLDVDAEFVGTMKPVYTHVDPPNRRDSNGG